MTQTEYKEIYASRLNFSARQVHNKMYLKAEKWILYDKSPLKWTKNIYTGSSE